MPYKRFIRKRPRRSASRRYFYKSGRMFQSQTKAVSRLFTNTSVYKFKRTFQFANLHCANGVTGTYVGYSFKLNDLPNYTEFTALFDQYKITGIKIRLIPMQNEQVLGTTAYNIPPIYTVVDYDDDTALTASTDAMQYQNCKISTPVAGKQIIRYFVPHVAVAGYSGTFTSYMNKSLQWIDSASPDVKHYGFKIAVPPITTLDLNYSVVATYYVKCRNVR